MNKSESIASLATALAKFQAEVQNPKNCAINPHFKSKYAPLQEILNAVRPALAKHGLSVVQIPAGDGERIIITTMLLHSSGEWIEAEPLVLKADRATAQGAGSAITYGRRYALSALLGISSEDDDDGNAAMPTPTRPQTQAELATEPQLKRIFALSKQLKLDSQMPEIIKSKYAKGSSKELSKAEASSLIEWLTAYGEVGEA